MSLLSPEPVCVYRVQDCFSIAIARAALAAEPEFSVRGSLTIAASRCVQDAGLCLEDCHYVIHEAEPNLWQVWRNPK